MKNEPPKWLKDFIIQNAYTPTKEEIEKVQSQCGQAELIQKYSVVGELKNDT